MAVWREEENREMDNGGVGTNSWCPVLMVELKLLEFFEFRGCQPSVHLAGYGQQVVCRDVEALNRALLVRGDDGSEEI